MITIFILKKSDETFLCFFLVNRTKYKNKKTIVDKKRINQIMKRIKSEAKRNKIDYVLVKNFWNKLIQYSIKLERKIVK